MRTVSALRQLQVEFTSKLDTDEQCPLSREEKEVLVRALDRARKQCASLGLRSADHRFGRMYGTLGSVSIPVNHAWAVVEINTLLEAIEDDSQREHFFHYPTRMGEMLVGIPSDWKETISAFPSVKNEIDDAVDCFALGHPTAAVFHLMRVAEHGLRALARERGITLPKGKPLEWGTWQDIIERIEDSVTGKIGLGKTLSAGPEKDAALSFYSGALGHFHAFKDQYRNMVMHVRKRYEPLEAERALDHVRDFMNGLSLKIGEKTTRPIRRWP